ncbi:MAG: hypothetical protein OHK93_006994 [Ramalina farinacea]|uniref:Uncharacterized protein n=1 Tax=Ramalina farinacea TaxID=258253 RepID=A0AA43QJN1_9LECA|nr:hypothetical protein [Ramalina farinacea]
MALRALAAALSLSYLAATDFAVIPLGSMRNGETPSLAKRDVLQRRDDVDPATLYPAYNISVPVDHFHNESMYEPHSSDTFDLRYFFDGSHYKAGGPVIVLEGGETDASGRLPYLQKGLLAQLSQATNGIGVVLEHRYYGTSFPTPDLSTENLRFLTTDQALADTVYFAQNVKFEGLEDANVNAPDAPYIAYGGSYAGAFVAFLRVLYPDVYFGAISSSGVTEAIWDYWDYYEPVREYGPQPCISRTQLLTNVVDNILLHKNGTNLTSTLKTAFGLQSLTHDDDFANALSLGVGGWQGRNWDPAVNDPSFSQYCGNMSANSTLYPSTTPLTPTVQKLLTAAGYSSQLTALTIPMLNYIGYINATAIPAAAAAGQSLEQYYTNHNSTFYALDSIAEGSWRSWPYQYCSQWGFLQTGSGVPSDQLPLISRLLTLDYESIICRDAFNLTTPADTDAINKYGGYDISYDRLAIIDGEQDPWRGVTPHSPQAPNPNRVSTTQEPFALIAGAVHHWDENGLFANETSADLPPGPVREVQAEEVAFVKAWLGEFEPPGGKEKGRRRGL